MKTIPLDARYRAGISTEILRQTLSSMDIEDFKVPKCGKYIRIPLSLPSLVITIEIIVLALAFMSGSNVLAQTLLHNQTLYEELKQSSNLHENSKIDVGDYPTRVYVDHPKEAVYVANHNNNSVSVISTVDNTKIKDIPVGVRPIDVVVDEAWNRVYVANYGDDTVSIISGENNTKIKDIPVGQGPVNIGVEPVKAVYVAGYYNNTVTVINGTTLTKIKNIPVGMGPIDIAVGAYHVYTANLWDRTVSVIDKDILKVIDTIRLGVAPQAVGIFNDTAYLTSDGNVSVILTPEFVTGPEDVKDQNPHYNITYVPTGLAGHQQFLPAAQDIDVDESAHIVYVLNRYSNDVSLISMDNNTNIKNLTVGLEPEAVRVNNYTHTVYVANHGSNTVSVINGTTLTKIKDIPVGVRPIALGFDYSKGTLYVANSESNSVSVIDGISNRVVAGVTFQVNPFNSGYIVCDDLTTPSPDDQTPPSPTGHYTYLYSGTKCVAKPNEGFEFSSWEENLGGNATQLINASGSASTLDSFLEFLHLKSEDTPEATLNITKFGTFTANFREVPPPLPPEFWAQMYAIIATVVTALFIPSIVGWFKSRRDAKKLDYYHKQIASLYDDGKLDENDMEALDRLRIKISDAYSEGKVNEKHYENLRVEISTLYEEIFRKKIDPLNDNKNSTTNKSKQEHLDQIRDEVEYAYSKGKLNEKHYDLLTKSISKLDGKESDDSQRLLK